MKSLKKITLLIVMTAVMGAPLAADEISAVWTRLYRNATSLEHKAAIMERIIEQENRDLIPVMDEALEELILMWENLPNSTERAIHRELMITTIQGLGSLKAVRSADRVYQVVETSDDAFLEATAIRALAEMGARDYAGKIAEHLSIMNKGITNYGSRQEIETVVSSCVYALERLKEPVGYEAVFFAEQAGYSSLVNKKIERALPKILEDPTEILSSILIDYTDPIIKLSALTAAGMSQAPAERIAEVAIKALNQGLTINVEDRTKSLTFSRLRIKAAEIIRDSGIDSYEASGLLRIMLSRKYEMNEMLTCIGALGSQTNDVAAKALSDFLSSHNERPADLRKADDYRFVIATIYALGNTGNSIGIANLTAVEFCDWNRDVRKAAEEALAKIQ